jgi:photosystem II stability/assembly factor-like uncharacterized protein
VNVTILIGTDRGAFVLRSDAQRRKWAIEGPLFKGWKVTAAERDPGGTWLLGTTSMVYGCAIQRSRDLRDWQQVEKGPAYSEDSGRKLEQIWKLCCADGVYYAGVAQAGLFKSTDGGGTWAAVTGLNDHPTRSAWMPGAGGLCTHSILVDPGNPARLWAGISAVGVFRSEDGGRSWQAKNMGVPVILEDKNHPDIGYCVHAIVLDPADSRRIYRQDHRGMFRSSDGGDRWERIENGLSSGYGFPLVIDRRTRTLFAFPLESDEYRLPQGGRFRVYRSRNQGDSWEALSAGLPQEDAYDSVMRNAMATDHLDPCGVYLGSTSGSVYVSSNAGDNWQRLPCTLPRVHCVTAVTD